MTEEVYAKCAPADTPTLQYCEAVAGRRLPDAPSEFDSELLEEMLDHARALLDAETPTAPTAPPQSEPPRLFAP
ncbi:MAG: hypothetical protein ACJ74Q_14950 [Pyrinomonadaceae bacterium]